MTPTDIAAMAETVAKAIYATTGAEEAWEDLTPEEQADFLLAANAAMGAHDAWLTMNGYRILRPKGDRSKLVTPDKRLLGPTGEAIN